MTIEQLLNKYPKIFQDYEGNPGKVNYTGIPQGWIPILDIMCGSIQNHIDNSSRWDKDLQRFTNPTQVVCTQMKEKFGGLRFYTNGHDDIVEGMITMAEYMCDQVCEDCGSKEDLGVTSGWIRNLCRTCVIAHGDRAMQAWTPKNPKHDRTGILD